MEYDYDYGFRIRSNNRTSWKRDGCDRKQPLLKCVPLSFRHQCLFDNVVTLANDDDDYYYYFRKMPTF